MAAAIAYLRQPEMTKLLRLDGSRIVLIGHSMGGFMAVQGAAADPGVVGIGLISAADLGGRIPQPFPKAGASGGRPRGHGRYYCAAEARRSCAF